MKFSQLKIVSAIIVLLGIFYISSISNAEMEVDITSNDINVELMPENPEPYGDVTITVTSYSTDLDKAFIEWKNGSSTVLSGYGKKSYSFKALGPNTTTTISAIVIPAGSTSKVTKQILISPSAIEVLWEAVDGYTPPFYRGKSFPSAGGTIKVVAIPQSKGNIVYTWKQNENTVANASGYNKDSYTFKNDALDIDESIMVSASSVDGKYDASKRIAIPIVSPELVFYRKTLAEGVLYNEGFTNEATITDDEITLVAEPYFLAYKGKEGNFTYSWKINGEDIETPSKKTELTVQPSSKGGYARIGLTLEDLDTLYQKVSATLKLNL